MLRVVKQVVALEFEPCSLRLTGSVDVVNLSVLLNEESES